MIRAFSFLQRHPKSGILYFRKRIPERYRLAFNGRNEIKKSLRTCDKKIAMPRAMVLYAELQNTFNVIDGATSMSKKKDSPRLYSSQWIKENAPWGKIGNNDSTIEDESESNDELLEDIMQAVKRKRVARQAAEHDDLDSDFIEKIVVPITGTDGVTRDMVIEDPGKDIVKETEAAARLLGMLPHVDVDDRRSSSSVKSTQSVDIEDSLKLAEAIDKFCAERKRSGEWSTGSGTDRAYESSLAWLLQYFGNVEIATITKPKVRTFCEKLQQFPPNPTKGQFEGKRFNQILKEDYEKVISVPTYNNTYISRYSALFNWAVDKGYCAINPFARMKLRNKGKSIDSKKPFTMDELKQIFDPGGFNTQMLNDWQFWNPLLALYSGARQQEIAQFRACDNVENEGILCMHFRPYKDDNPANGRLKNEHSERVVPAHTRLLDLGFRAYLDKVQNAGSDKLFPELFASKTIKAGDKVSRWFNRTHFQNCRLLDVKAERKISYHSFCHNFTDRFKKAMKPEAVAVRSRDVRLKISPMAHMGASGA